MASSLLILTLLACLLHCAMGSPPSPGTSDVDNYGGYSTKPPRETVTTTIFSTITNPNPETVFVTKIITEEMTPIVTTVLSTKFLTLTLKQTPQILTTTVREVTTTTCE